MLLTKWDICNPLGVSWREKVRGEVWAESLLSRNTSMRTCVDPSARIWGRRGSKTGHLFRGKLTSLPNNLVPLFFFFFWFPSITLSLKCQCLLFTQVHLHVLVFKTWQPPQIKTALPSVSLQTFLSQHSRRVMGVLTRLLTLPQNKAELSPRHYWQVTHWLLCALFQTPKKTTNFD